MKYDFKLLSIIFTLLSLTIVIIYLKPKIIEGHKVNNEWHKDNKIDNNGVTHNHPYSWAMNQEHSDNKTSDNTTSENWVDQAFSDGYNCFKDDDSETFQEKRCRILGIEDCNGELDPDIYVSSESDPSTSGFENLFSKKNPEPFINAREIDFNKISPILKKSTVFKYYHYNKFYNTYTFLNNPIEANYLFDNNVNTSGRFKSIEIEPNQNINNAENENEKLPNGIVFGPLTSENLEKPGCLSNEDSPAIVISLTCGKNPLDAPTRFILSGTSSWNGSQNTLHKFKKLVLIEDIKFTKPYQESTFVFKNKICYLTSYHITFFHKDGPKLITLNNIQLYYEKNSCLNCYN